MSQDKYKFIEQLKLRFKNFVIDSTKLFRDLPQSGEAKIFGNQFLRSSSSAGANYHAACRARSTKEFYAKLSIVVEEIDEACFWLEILTETKVSEISETANLLKEAQELLAIVARARKNIYK